MNWFQGNKLAEAKLKNLQDQLERNLFSTDQEMDSLKVTDKELFSLIEREGKQTLLNIQQLKKEVETILKDHFVTKLCAQKELTNLRMSLLTDIAKARKSASRELTMFFTGVTLALTVCGWIYVYVVRG